MSSNDSAVDSLGGFPPGVVPNYVDPPDHRTQTIILHTIILTLVTTAVAMRLYTRAFITKFKLGIDDCFLAFSWASTVAWSGVLIASENYGIGRHLWDIPPDWLVPGLKLLFVTELMYCVIVLSIKLSFLLSFNRIFTANHSKLKWFIWFAIFANTVFYIVVFFDTLFLCKPIALSWNPFLDGKCGSERALPYASGAWGFIGDFYIFFLPMPSVWSLNMKRTKKMKLTFAFGVGLFACIASIVRFAYTIPLVNDVDSTWNYITLSLWAVLEVDIGLICCCFLTFPAFFERYKPAKWDQYMSHLASYISGSSRSTASSSNTRNQYNGGVTAVQKPSQASDSYQSLGQLPLDLRGDIDTSGDDVYRAKARRGNVSQHEVEEVPLRDEKNVRKTADVENNYSVEEY